MKQLSIITKNRLGIVAEISEALGAANINIESIDAQLTDDNALIVLNVDQYDKALQVIHNFTGMEIVTEDAILVRLDNEPGALGKLARRFTDANINLRGVRLVSRDPQGALVAISTDRSDEALALVADVLVA